jgi:uncharacterized membrane protein YphA (DoxX/SURF4 family)
MRLDTRLNQTWWILKIAFGVVPIVAGADKFFNLLTHWDMYLHPAIPRLLHIQASTFMHMVGVIEIVAGLVVLSNLTRWGAYIVMLWLLGIALSLIAQLAYSGPAHRSAPGIRSLRNHSFAPVRTRRSLTKKSRSRLFCSVIQAFHSEI